MSLTLVATLVLACVAFGLVFLLGRALGSQPDRGRSERYDPDRRDSGAESARAPAPAAPLAAAPTPAPAARSAAAADADPEVLSALAAGQKILAIKLYREKTGVGLKEAKEAVERL